MIEFDWVPIQKRLPEYDKQVLVYRPGKGVITSSLAQTDKNGPHFWCDFIVEITSCYARPRETFAFNSVSHWRDLPAPPISQEDLERIANL